MCPVLQDSSGLIYLFKPAVLLKLLQYHLATALPVVKNILDLFTVSIKTFRDRK